MRRFKTAAAMTALCGVLGACADLTPHPQYPVSLPPAPPPPPVVAPPPPPPPVAKSDDDSPRAAPSTPIEQSALPPPPGAKAAPPRKGSALEPRYEDDADGDVTVFAAASHEGSVTVGKGETLAKIAKANGVSVEDLAKANQLPPPYRLKAGQTLTLPGSAPAEDKSAKDKTAKGKPKSPETVTVGQGETLAKIAKANGVSLEDLAQANDLKPPYRLRVGQTLALQAPEPAAKAQPPKASAKPAATSVTVARGQTLQSIAEDAGVPVADLAKLNHIRKPYRVRRGQVIKLPEDQAQAAPSSSPPSSTKSSTARPAPERVVTVGRHQTLETIAEHAGIPVAELAKLNHLKKPYRLLRGQRIKLPGQAGPAPEAASYKVQKGDSLYSIARQFHTDAKTLAGANGLDADAHLTVGRRLQLPGGPLDKPTPIARRTPDVAPSHPEPYAAVPANPPTSSAPGLAPPPPVQPYMRPAPTPEAAAPPSVADTDVAAAGRGLFQWPIRGRVLSMYGPKPGAQRNDGLDIAGAQGDPVRAAAAGEVVYAGNSVPGFGNLVLIRHDGGWVTAYAHLANLDVKMRQTVTQGQQIGEVGQTGGVDQPQLHFEVRYAPSVKDKARPIDPLLVLPQ
jgi:murein DD-endopeptidase MepM/ murein hydrolase activator NlpD